MTTIGILALQGGIEEHQAHLNRLGIKHIVPVKKAGQLAACQGLILPGGESTAIGKTLRESPLLQAITGFAKQGKPVWGTCAGLILLAQKISGENNYLGLLEISVCRNGYGRQLDSFKTTAVIPEVSEQPLPLVFIRAPYISQIGPGVKVLLKLNQKIVAVKQKNIIATSFHPELTDDLSFHRYFLELVQTVKDQKK